METRQKFNFSPEPFLKMIKFIENHKIFAIIITILIAAEIFYFSSISLVPSAGPESGINLSIVYHFIIFFLLAFFLIASIKNKNQFKNKHMIIALLISLIYAISDEVHQLFVPGRFFSIKDILTDLLGILVAILIYPKKK